MPGHYGKSEKKLPKKLRIVEPKKKLKSEEPKPKKKLPKTLRIKEPEKPTEKPTKKMPTKKLPKTLRIVEPVKPKWLLEQSKKKYYIAFDKSTGKEFDYETYLNADDKKILGKIYEFKGFNPEAYVTDPIASDESNKEVIEAKPRITKIYNKMIKNLVVYEGKMVLDKTSKTTKVSMKFPEPIGIIKIPPKLVQRFKKGQLGATVNGFKIDPSLDSLFHKALLNNRELREREKKRLFPLGEPPKKYNTKSL